jgi:hypothetical protein
MNNCSNFSFSFDCYASFALLYSYDEPLSSPSVTIKAVGHHGTGLMNILIMLQVLFLLIVIW